MNHATQAPASATEQIDSSPAGGATTIENPNADERIVFSQLHQIAAAVVEMHDGALTKDGAARFYMNAQYLCGMAAEIAQQMTTPGATGDIQGSMARIEALMEGALAIDLVERPGAHERHALTKRGFELAESASISYGFEQEGCEALALGIKTAQRHGGERTVEQLKEVLELIATHLANMRRLVMMLQGNDCPVEFTPDVLSSIEMLARTAGGIADEFSGVNILGDRDYWTFGANFVRAGGAA